MYSTPADTVLPEPGKSARVATWSPTLPHRSARMDRGHHAVCFIKPTSATASRVSDGVSRNVVVRESQRPAVRDWPDDDNSICINLGLSQRLRRSPAVAITTSTPAAFIASLEKVLSRIELRVLDRSAD